MIPLMELGALFNVFKLVTVGMVLFVFTRLVTGARALYLFTSRVCGAVGAGGSLEPCRASAGGPQHFLLLYTPGLVQEGSWIWGLRGFREVETGDKLSSTGLMRGGYVGPDTPGCQGPTLMPVSQTGARLSSTFFFTISSATQVIGS